MFRKALFSPFFKNESFLKSLALSTLTLGTYSLYEKYKNQAFNCGIIAYLGKDPNATDVILNGIKLLQNRGYDSTGIATISPTGDLLLTKLASDASKKIDCIERIDEIAPPIHKGSKVGIGHTRWATCGEKTDVNAHPHTDSKNRVAVVHNGTLENVEELREELKTLGINLASKTDTEVIPQFIGYYLDQGLSFHDAVTKTLKEKLIGTWGLVILNKAEPDKLVVCRNGSPLLIGLTQSAIYVASESIAFEKFTSNQIKLEDHEIIYIDIKNAHEFYKNVTERIQTVNAVNPQIKPKEPFTTFFEQEIMEQPESITKCLHFGARLGGEPGSAKLGGFDSFRDELIGIKHLVIVACGSSYYAGLYGAKFYKLLGCFETVQVFIASEFSEDDLPEEGAGVLLISQSGETADVYRALTLAKNKGIPSIGVVNVVGSLIASSVDCGIYLNTGREVSVPATKSFTSQIVALILSALWFSHNKGVKSKYKIRGEAVTQLHSLPITVGKTLYDIDERCKQLADVLAKEEHLFILGKGFGDAIAKEAALKLKEVTYIHAESFASGEIKHGSLALIESHKTNHTKVILFIFNDEYLNDMLLTLSEMKANKAYTAVITDQPSRVPSGKVDFLFEIPHLGYLTGLLSILPIQKLAYYIALKKHINMDKPRNLAKTVTVQ